MKIKPYKETHMHGLITLENDYFYKTAGCVAGDFGIQITEDGRVWICINGVAFIRFHPTPKPETEVSEQECTCEKMHEMHECPYQVLILGNYDPEFCDCCPACTAACRDEV